MLLSSLINGLIYSTFLSNAKRFRENLKKVGGKQADLLLVQNGLVLEAAR